MALTCKSRVSPQAHRCGDLVCFYLFADIVATGKGHKSGSHFTKVGVDIQLHALCRGVERKRGVLIHQFLSGPIFESYERLFLR